MLSGHRNELIGAKKQYNRQYIIDCSEVDSLPDLTITLGGYNFTMGPHDYVVKVYDTCISTFVPVSGVATEWVALGVPFLRRWYSVYDFGTDSIGLAMAA